MFKVDQSRRALPGAVYTDARADLWLPRAELSSCIRAVISRDTRNATLRDEQRYNHFAASPICNVVWYFEGRGEMLDGGFPADANSPRRPFGPLCFAGGFDRPAISWNPGPMHAMMLALMPDAVAALIGIEPGCYINRIVPAEEVFDADWLAMFAAVAAAPDDEARVCLIESFLNPRWQAARPDAASPMKLYADWTRSLALRAGLSGRGRSLRQLERRIKQWTGQPLRELRGFDRAEKAFFEGVMADRAGTVDWRDVADSSGYADQSHLCRQTRRLTGFPPNELRRRIYADETFWCYRLWGFSETHLVG